MKMREEMERMEMLCQKFGHKDMHCMKGGH